MKRFVRELVVALILGSIVSIAVAWSCALWSKKTNFNTEPQFEPEIVLSNRYSIDEIAGVNYSGRQAQGFGNLYVHCSALQVGVGEQDSRVTTVNMYRFGWPMLCVTGENRFGYHVEHKGLRTMFLTPEWLLDKQRLIAFGPRPLGMLVNSLVYGTPIWILMFGSRRLKTTIRKRNKRCTNCGYDLRGTFAAGIYECPECNQRADEETITNWKSAKHTV